MASTVPSRRFLPPDPRVEEPYRVTPKLALRIGILGMLALAVFAALFLRLWALQVLAGTQYLRTAQNNQLRTIAIPAQRGPILDRNGKTLVTNAAATAIEVWPADLPKHYADRLYELRRLARITGIPLYDIGQRLRRHENDPLTPVVIEDAARNDVVVYLSEHQREFPGVQEAKTYVRHYPYGTIGAQILGYTAEISPQQLKTLSKQGYRGGDVIGQAGVEAAYDRWLRGQAGTAHLRVDSLGRPRSDITPTNPPVPGRAVRLTIDLNLQRAAERALAYGIRLAQVDGHWAANGGAIVALDPRNGAILASASSPTYNPAVYAGRVTTKKLDAAGLTNRTAPQRNFPALNRALTGTYPPGSSFKPVTALAAMQEHLLQPYASIPCTGTYTSPHDIAHTPFHNWDPGVSALINLPTALAMSCDTYFYYLGDRFYELRASRGHPFQEWAYRFGFGKRSGVDVGPEASGLVPTPEWRKHHFTAKTDPCCWRVDQYWKPGNSIQLAIGQGDLLVTPLQMARFYALLANGGRLVTPHFLYDVENPGAAPLPTPALRAPLETGVDPNALEAVRTGLYAATHSSIGTSSAVFGSFPVPIAGKTGTAEKVVTLPGYSTPLPFDQSWWCGYGPYDDPRLVVCAVIENGGHGGTAAAPAALHVFEQFFHRKAPELGAIHSD